MIVVPDDMKEKDDVPSRFNRTGKYQYPLTFYVDGKVNEKTDVLKYITSVEVDKTLAFNSKRLREPYEFIVKAYKGKEHKEVKLKLDIRRCVLDLIKPGIRYKGH